MLRMDDSFRITPLITWFSVTSSGELQGSFTYNQVKICSGPGALDVPNPYWISTYCQNA